MQIEQNETLKNKKNNFARGAMLFEDYGYNMINKYVLINPDHETEAEEEEGASE